MTRVADSIGSSLLVLERARTPEDIAIAMPSFAQALRAVLITLAIPSTSGAATLAEINEVKRDTETILSSLQNLDTDVVTAQAAIAALQAAIDALPPGTDTSALDTAIENLQTSVNGIDTSVGELQTDVTSVKGVVDEVPGDITDARDNVNTNTNAARDMVLARVNSEVGDVDTALLAVQTAVSGVQTAVDAVPTDAVDLSGVDTALDTLQTALGTLDTEVDEVKTVVDGIPANVIDARDHVERYSNWNIEEGRLGEQPMIVQNGKYLPERSFNVSQNMSAWNYGNLFSDGTTLWIYYARNCYAYNLSTGSEDSSKDFSIPSSVVIGGQTYTINTSATRGSFVYSNSTHAWFIGGRSNNYRLLAWRLSTRTRDSSEDGLENLARSSSIQNGVAGQAYPFCDGNHIWLIRGPGNNSLGEAYTFPNLVQSSDNDLNNLGNLLDSPEVEDMLGKVIVSGVLYGVGRLSPEDRYDIFAYSLTQHGRDPCRDLRNLHLANNRDPMGILAVNNRIYVLDKTQRAVYAYQLGDKRVGFGRIIL